MTILEKLQKNTNNCLDNPSILSEYLIILASHILVAEKDKVIAEVKYAQKWSEFRKNEKSDKSCDMKMKLEAEYIELKSKEAMGRTILETIRAIKKRLAFLSVEYHELSNIN